MVTKLFTEFNTASDQDWVDKVQKDLKGATIESLSSHLPYEGIELKALYTKANHVDLPILKSKNEWEIREDESTPLDPIAHLNIKGKWSKTKEEDFEYLFSAFDGHLVVNAYAYGAAGSSAVQELTYTIAHINEYLNYIQTNRIELKAIDVKLSIGVEYFINISKFRALRILISNLLKAYAFSECAIKIHASNNSLYFSKEDINGNILRSTTQCISAVLGGCDSISIIPHNGLIEADGAFGKRVARNLQQMLKHEAHLDKVADPASGSYFLDNLTAELSSICWKKFKDVESKGGYIIHFLNGNVQNDIQRILQKRVDRARSGDDVLVGINKYQLETDTKTIKETPSTEQGPGLTPMHIESLI